MGERILVVDDEKVVLGAVRKALKKDDYEIDTIGNAEEALKMLKNNKYDLIITDLMMPDIDGIELLKILHDMDLDIQAIMITGYPTIQTAMTAKRFGAFEYITKPFTRQELRSVVIRAIRHGKQQDEKSKVSTEESNESKYYIPEHAWVVLEDELIARIGMANTFSHTVGEIDVINLPKLNTYLEQGRLCLVVKASDGIEHSLHSPLTGRVVEINQKVLENKSLIYKEAEKAGWLFKIEANNTDREIDNLVPA